MKRTQSATFATENRKPVAAAGTKTIARNKVHTTPRTNGRLGLCPRRSKISGTTTNGRRIAAKVAATIQTVVAVSAMAFRATASNRQKVSVGLPSPDHVLSSARAIRPAERRPMKIAVIGAGEMGHGIAELAALHGHEVRMRDIKPEYIDRGMERIRWSLDKLVGKNQLKREQADEALARIHGTLDVREACREADIAIEAVFEDPELKKKVYLELDQAAQEKTIFAPTTPALPITGMAGATKRPQKVVGMHFFNPPMLMQLVEVIRADTTSDATLQAAVDLATSFGKTVVVVKKDVPGFITTRVLGPYFEEAARIHETEGVPIQTIDEAMRLGTAFPKGPLATADDLGIDVVVAALKTRKGQKPARLLSEMVARGDIGVKSGKGFYDHRSGGRTTTYETLLVTRDAATHVATVTINRGDRLNTLTPQVFEELEVALAALETDDDVRCLVLTGAGDRSFSAGADLTSFGDITKALKVWRFSLRSEEIMSRLANFPKATIAAINGHCFGGGLELALACDFRVAASRAKLGQTEVNLGLVPGAGGTQRLVRVLGQAKAKELVFLGSRLTAEEAAAIGLVTKAVTNEAFAAEVRSFAEKLAKQAPIAVRLAKALLNRSDMPIDAALEMEAMAFGLVSSTEDIYEGLQAFTEKREPRFKGE